MAARGRGQAQFPSMSMNHTTSLENPGAAQHPMAQVEGLAESTALLLPRKRHWI